MHNALPIYMHNALPIGFLGFLLPNRTKTVSLPLALISSLSLSFFIK